MRRPVVVIATSQHPLCHSRLIVLTSDSVYEKLTTILRDVFNEDAIVAVPGLTADQVAGWDSLAHLRVILTVERTFGVKFSASQISSLKNVGELAALIDAKVAG